MGSTATKVRERVKNWTRFSRQLFELTTEELLLSLKNLTKKNSHFFCTIEKNGHGLKFVKNWVKKLNCNCRKIN